MAFARHQFALMRPVGGGTLRDHLEVAARQTGKPDPRLTVPELPACVEHVFAWFGDLHACRSSGFSPNPISYAELAGWAALTGAEPTPWEVQALRRLDDEFLAETASWRDDETTPPKGKT